MSKLATYLKNMSIKSQIVDTILERVHNVDLFSAELYEQMAEAPLQLGELNTSVRFVESHFLDIKTILGEQE